MLGCPYCRDERVFWASDGDIYPYGERSDYYGAYIEAGTNIFHDTARRKMNFHYCPMCGRSLLDERINKGALPLFLGRHRPLPV